MFVQSQPQRQLSLIYDQSQQQKQQSDITKIVMFSLLLNLTYFKSCLSFSIVDFKLVIV